MTHHCWLRKSVYSLGTGMCCHYGLRGSMQVISSVSVPSCRRQYENNYSPRIGIDISELWSCNKQNNYSC